MTKTITIPEIMNATGLSRHTLYQKFFDTGVIPRVSKGKYDAEKAQAVIVEVQAKKNTLAPTRCGVAKSKLQILEDWGIIAKEENGRYSKDAINLAKHLNVHTKDGKIFITKSHPRHRTAKADATAGSISLKDMAQKSGMTKSTLLHYIRQGKIEANEDGSYNKASFNSFLKDYKHLQKTSLDKKGVINQLGITDDEYLNLLHSNKLEKASFERYTKKSINKLEKLGRDNWETAPTYQNMKAEKSYSNRDVPDSELMTFQEVSQALGRKKSTIVHLVKEGKIELVRRNGYSKESVENYLKMRNGDKSEPIVAESTPVEETVSTPEKTTYTAKEVKQLLGIDGKTGLTYYLKHNLIESAGRNQYTKASVDRYLESKKARHNHKRTSVSPRKKVTMDVNAEIPNKQVHIEEVNSVTA